MKCWTRRRPELV